MYFKEKRSWQIPPEPVDEKLVTGTETADIVIVGAGHSGVLAARSAVEEGASVILLEKSQKESHNVYGNDVGTFNSRFARENGVPEYDPVDIILEYQKRSINRCNTELIRQYAYHSGEAFDWFIDALDPRYKESIALFMKTPPKYFEGELNGYKNFIGTMGFRRLKGYGLAQAIKDTVALFEDRGGNVRYGICAEYLEKDDTGRVTGVICRETQTGTYRRFKAGKGVLLAAGDFGGNREMILDLLDEFAELSENMEKYELLPTLGRDGSGIRMGIWAGGRIQPAPRGGMYCCQTGRGGYMGGAAFLRLNAHGKRYTNEGIMGYWAAGLRAARQPEGKIVTIWDSNWREELEYQSADHLGVDINEPGTAEKLTEIMKGALGTGRDGYDYADPNMTWKDPENKAKPVKMPGAVAFTVHSGSTMEELAENLGFTGRYGENFIASVKRYNELCRKGRDEDFAKDSRLMHALEHPPYFATATRKDPGGVMVAVAGLVVDGNQQVLDCDQDPIPGLFATGNCAGEVFPLQYSTPIGGSSIGMCHALGRQAGLYLARL